MTDWPMESMQSTKHAIMAVGYDTLELLALSAVPRGYYRSIGTTSDDHHQTDRQQRRTTRRLLDLCCGCGIQGLWAFQCAQQHHQQLQGEEGT
eukprot:930030-Ditylum_brightwellii.AAC.1